MIGRVSMAAVLCCAALIPARAARDAEAEWREWRDAQNAYYSAVRFAVLKVDDAVFLKPGETAWMLTKPGDPSSYRWSLEAAEDGVLHIAFMNFSTVPGTDEFGYSFRLVHGDESGETSASTSEPHHLPVNPVIDIEIRITGEGTGDPRLQLKIYNQKHPAAEAFGGLDFFDYAPQFRIEAAFEPLAVPAAVILDTERGLRKRFWRAGVARFSLEGKTIRLPLYALDANVTSASEWFTLFTDETTGKESYGIGRYLDVEPPKPGGAPRVVIDFNRAYNPLCARSKHFNCPLVEFHIPVAVTAGEKAPR